MKIKGGELQKWMDEGWPGDDWYWEHELFDDNPEPDQSYDTGDINGLYYQGKSPEVRELPSIDTLIRRWRRSRDFALLSVDCPKAVEDEIREYLKLKGCKVTT